MRGTATVLLALSCALANPALAWQTANQGTDTAEENVPMRRVNEALGYRPTRRLCHYRLDL